MSETKRLRKFREEIAKGMPTRPNDKATQTELLQKPLTHLLIDYLNWAVRHVHPRPRTTQVRPAVTNDNRWNDLKPAIEALLGKVRRGESLEAHLSKEAFTAGYASRNQAKKTSVNAWADKDFVLNTMGYHHFHLGQNVQSNGLVTRTNDVLFARVSQSEFVAIALFDHSVFDDDGASLNAERQRLWQEFDRDVTLGTQKGAVVMPRPIATSGHPVQLVMLAQQYAWIVNQIDPQLDDGGYVDGLYSDAGLDRPKRPKLEWWMDGTDLGLFEKNYQMLFLLHRGLN